MRNYAVISGFFSKYVVTMVGHLAVHTRFSHCWTNAICTLGVLKCPQSPPTASTSGNVRLKAS